MKRALPLILGLVIAIAGIGFGLALARPDLFPEWARLPEAPAAPEHSADSGLYCNEHGVPEKFCTLCHPELKESLLLCKEHWDIPEDICTLCHPEVEEQHNIVTCEHELPASFCPQCAGEPVSLNMIDDGWCTLHNRPEETCTECEGGRPKGASATSATCRRPLPMVRFASAELARTIGIETAEVARERHAHYLLANAETAYDANRYAEIRPRVSGFIREIKADLGQSVNAGEVLAVVDSPEVSTAKSQLLSSRAALRLAEDQYRRVRSLIERKAVAIKDEIEAQATLHQAQAAAQDAEQRLRNLGYTDAELERILKEKDTGSHLQIVSPIAGTLVFRHAVLGEAVEATTRLFAVADTSTMWLWVDVYESDIKAVASDQPVRFTISGAEAEGKPAAGKVTWVGTEVDEKTRTTRVRAELANPQGRLRANQFGLARIEVGREHEAVVVPRDAVQRSDNTDVVFLPVAEGRYRPQRIVTKPSGRSEFLEVDWGLEPGEKVVTTGAFLLKTEITQGAIGAGCCE
ncbi:hypothetical protein BH23PLA1_BH23PLA1_12210 [soil metagenome]